MGSSRARRGRRLAAALAVAAAIGAGGCAGGATGGGPTPMPAATAGAATAELPVVQVREFPGGSEVTIVAWSPAAPDHGLRAHVNRDGALVGRHRLGDHRLFVSTPYVEGMGGFALAWVVPVPPGPVLLHDRPVADPQACDRGVCAPRSVVNVQMPDALLRAHRDSLVVTFSAGRYTDWRIAVEPAVVDAYLQAVDSVRAARTSARAGAR